MMAAVHFENDLKIKKAARNLKAVVYLLLEAQ